MNEETLSYHVRIKDEYKDDIINGVEIWVRLTELGYSKYEISSFGKVRSDYTNRLLSIIKNRIGYHKVGLKNDKNGYCDDLYFHRLLALTFLVKPDGNVTVDHIDRNTDNNNLSNLRWATASTQLYNRGNIKRKPLAVLQYDKNWVLIREWTSPEEITEENPTYKFSTIEASIFRKKKSAYGFFWTRDKRDLPGEEWRYHPIIKTLEVSDKGRVKNKFGFPVYGYVVDGYMLFVTDKKQHSVHNLVAAAFIDGYDKDTMIVYHENGDTGDNNVENLRIRAKRITKSKDDPPYVPDLSDEKWSKHPTLSGMKVSDKGRVKNKGQKPTLGRPFEGYYYCDHYVDKKRKAHQVHNLVAATFVDGFDENTQVFHKDGNTQNNDKDNIGLRPKKTKRKREVDEERDKERKKTKVV